MGDGLLPEMTWRRRDGLGPGSELELELELTSSLAEEQNPWHQCVGQIPRSNFQPTHQPTSLALDWLEPPIASMAMALLGLSGSCLESVA